MPTTNTNSKDTFRSEAHKNFATALKLAIKILPVQLTITNCVRKMSEEERSLFQATLNQHPLMLEELKDRVEKEKSEEEVNEMELMQELAKDMLSEKKTSNTTTR